MKSAFKDLEEVILGDKATIDQEELAASSEVGRMGKQESNGKKENLNRTRLIEMATERLKAQCKQIEEMKRALLDNKPSRGCGDR